MPGLTFQQWQYLMVFLYFSISATTAIALYYFYEDYYRDRRRGGQRENHRATYDKEWWEKRVPHFGHAKFVRTFRVSRRVAQRLVEEAQKDAAFEVHPSKVWCASSPYKQVCMFLFKNGRPISFFDVAERFGVSEGHAHECVYRVLDFILRRFEVRRAYE
jgi:hypothetical protein